MLHNSQKDNIREQTQIINKPESDFAFGFYFCEKARRANRDPKNCRRNFWEEEELLVSRALLF